MSEHRDGSLCACPGASECWLIAAGECFRIVKMSVSFVVRYANSSTAECQAGNAHGACCFSFVLVLV